MVNALKRRIYISADYDPISGDRQIIEKLYAWRDSGRHNIWFTDTAGVASGSVSQSPDCRICELKLEFNKQINSSSLVLFIVGDRTAARCAGKACRNPDGLCTPYKGNTNGRQLCKYPYAQTDRSGNVGAINQYSYLEHEWRQAVQREKNIAIIFNSSRLENKWLPKYMTECTYMSLPFWKYEFNEKKPNYENIKNLICP